MKEYIGIDKKIDGLSFRFCFEYFVVRFYKSKYLICCCFIIFKGRGILVCKEVV